MVKVISGCFANQLADGTTNPREITIYSRKLVSDHRRWYNTWEVVFSTKGSLDLFVLEYSEPKTYEGEVEWEKFDTDDYIAVYRVAPRIVQSIEYDRVEDEE